MSFASSDLQELKDRADIVDILSNFVDIRRSGSSYACQCPWHDDRKPSLSIDPRRQTWRCWPCDFGGDVFAFLMRSGMSFPDAVFYVADKVGMTITQTDAIANPRERKLPLYESMQLVVDYYRSMYPGSPAESYALSRGITREVADRYGFGFAPNNFNALHGLKSVSEETLFKLGVAARTQTRGTRYDLLKNRLVIPIQDTYGRYVSVSGRDLSGEDSRKYVNGAASSLFDKSSVLYGFAQARQSIRSANQVIIVEGFMDCISLACAGLLNTVAAMGTAFTLEHLRLLSPLCDQVVILFDNDRAGLTKANDLLGLFVAADVDVRVAVVPDGKDPDEFIRASGVDALRSIISKSVDAIDYRMNFAFDGVDPAKQPARAAQAIDEIIPLLRVMHDGVRRDQVIAALARSCTVSIETISSLVRQQPKQFNKPVSVQPQPVAPKLTPREQTLFSSMMVSEAALSICIEHIEPDYLSAAGRSLYRLFATVEMLGCGTPFETLLAGSSDSVDLQSLVMGLCDSPTDPADAERIGSTTWNLINEDARRKMMANASLEEVLKRSQQCISHKWPVY